MWPRSANLRTDQSGFVIREYDIVDTQIDLCLPCRLRRPQPDLDARGNDGSKIGFRDIPFSPIVKTQAAEPDLYRLPARAPEPDHGVGTPFIFFIFAEDDELKIDRVAVSAVQRKGKTAIFRKL